MKSTIHYSLFTLFSVFALAKTARAADHTWTGTGPNDKWSTSSNWAGNSAPTANEAQPVNLIFPPGAGRLVNSCDITGLTVDAIYINGSNYNLSYVYQFPKPIKVSGAGIYSSGTGNRISIPLILNTPNTNFGITTNAELVQYGALTGTGSFQKTGRGKLALAGDTDNTFVAPATVLVGELHLNKAGGHLAINSSLIIGDTLGSAVGGGYDSRVFMDEDQQMPFGTPLTINPDGLLDMNGHGLAIGSLTMTGNARIDDYGGTKGTLTLLGNVNVLNVGPNDYSTSAIFCNISLGGATRTFHVDYGYLGLDGSISNGGGSAGIIKTGTGSLYLSRSNTYTGETIVNDGILYVNELSETTNIIVHSPGKLSGSGTMGTVNAHNAVFNPVAYNPSNNTELQHTTAKDVTLDGGSTFEILLDDVLLKPQPILSVNGTVNLGGAKFFAEFETDADFHPVIGTSFTLISNDGSDPIIGIFAGLPEGASFRFGGRQWKISYIGGTGNDVVLTLLSLQLPLSVDIFEMNKPVVGSVTLRGTGVPGIYYKAQFSTDLKVWQELPNISVSNNNGSLYVEIGIKASNPKCFYRIVSVPAT